MDDWDLAEEFVASDDDDEYDDDLSGCGACLMTIVTSVTLSVGLLIFLFL